MTERPALRVRKREQTRLDIVHAALDLFRENGYDSTTLDAIADRANYSRSTVLRYFGNKEDIAFVGLADVVGQIRPGLAASDPADSPWLTARRYALKTATDFIDNMTDLHVASVHLWFEEPALRRRYAELMIDSERQYAEFFADEWGIAADDVECQVTAVAVVGVIRVAFNGIQTKDPAAVKAIADRGFDLCEHGLPATVTASVL